MQTIITRLHICSHDSPVHMTRIDHSEWIGVLEHDQVQAEVVVIPRVPGRTAYRTNAEHTGMQSKCRVHVWNQKHQPAPTKHYHSCTLPIAAFTFHPPRVYQGPLRTQYPHNWRRIRVAMQPVLTNTHLRIHLPGGSPTNEYNPGGSHAFTAVPMAQASPSPISRYQDQNQPYQHVSLFLSPLSQRVRSMPHHRGQLV